MHAHCAPVAKSSRHKQITAHLGAAVCSKECGPSVQHTLFAWSALVLLPPPLILSPRWLGTAEFAPAICVDLASAPESHHVSPRPQPLPDQDLSCYSFQIVTLWCSHLGRLVFSPCVAISSPFQLCALFARKRYRYFRVLLLFHPCLRIPHLGAARKSWIEVKTTVSGHNAFTQAYRATICNHGTILESFFFFF